MSYSYTSSASHYSYQCAADELKFRGIKHRSIPFDASLKYEFKTEWEKLAKLCGSTSTHSYAFTEINKALTDPYASEEEFDTKLFHALYVALGESCCDQTENTTE